MVKQSCVSTNDKSFSPILACCNAFFQVSDAPSNAMMSRRLIGRKSLIWTVERKRTARYLKLGARGLGSERAARWGMALGSYVGASNEETLLIPVIEPKEASANIAGILSVPGLEAIFFWPADLSQSFGDLGVWEGPGMMTIAPGIFETPMAGQIPPDITESLDKIATFPLRLRATRGSYRSRRNAA
jgi:hypothetical protein